MNTASRSNRNILLVDDDTDSSQALADVLEAEGYLVSCAPDGAGALERLRNGPRPSIIVLEPAVLARDGWTFWNEQRHEAFLQAIPLVSLTHDQDEGAGAGALDIAACFVKPVDMPALLGAIERCHT